VLLRLIGKRQYPNSTYVGAGVMVVLTVLYVWFTLNGSRETQRSYYFVSTLYGACRRYTDYKNWNRSYKKQKW
ncbi:MAG: hypothetical protein QM793_01840, partial [Muricomes sp.]